MKQPPNGILGVIKETNALFNKAAGKYEKFRHPACEGHGCYKCYGKGFLTRAELKELRLRDKELAAAGQDIIVSPCSRCEGQGYVPHWRQSAETCPTCKGLKYVEDRFPIEVVRLANELRNQTPLVIAKTLAGLMLGMKP